MNIHKLRNSEKLKKIKMIALDLDGTTLTRNGLTRRTRETLEEAISQGIAVVIATGRPYTALPEKVKEIRGLDYVVISNGAHIIRADSGEFLYSNYIDEKASLSVRDFLMGEGFPVEVFTGGEAFVDRKLYDEMAQTGSTYLSAKYILRTRKPVDNIFEFWKEHAAEIENVNVQFEFQEDRYRMKDILSRFDKITLTSSTHHNLEVGGATTSKAAALKEVCRMMNLNMENVMAFGDSPNDSAMIKAAGIGIAMGNSTEDVLEIADAVAPTNDEEGVAYTVRMLLLGREDEIFDGE